MCRSGLAAREDEERDGRELATGGGEGEHMEKLVVAEHARDEVGPAKRIHDRAR